MYEITVKTSFSAAHHLREYKGNCENIHGHNWEVEVTASFEELPKDGMAIDFRDLKKVADDVVDKLDHKDINKIKYFADVNPTSENIAKFIFDGVKDKGVPVSNVKVFETGSYAATYSEKN